MNRVPKLAERRSHLLKSGFKRPYLWRRYLPFVGSFYSDARTEMSVRMYQTTTLVINCILRGTNFNEQGEKLPEDKIVTSYYFHASLLMQQVLTFSASKQSIIRVLEIKEKYR